MRYKVARAQVNYIVRTWRYDKSKRYKGIILVISIIMLHCDKRKWFKRTEPRAHDLMLACVHTVKVICIRCSHDRTFSPHRSHIIYHIYTSSHNWKYFACTAKGNRVECERLWKSINLPTLKLHDVIQTDQFGVGITTSPHAVWHRTINILKK